MAKITQLLSGGTRSSHSLAYALKYITQAPYKYLCELCVCVSNMYTSEFWGVGAKGDTRAKKEVEREARHLRTTLNGHSFHVYSKRAL